MDAQTAINTINAREAANNPMSVAELETLAAQVDAKTSGATLLLNSGGVGSYNITTGRYEFSSQQLADSLADGQNTKTIRNVEIGKFLNHIDFTDALQNAAVLEGKNFNELYLGTNSNGVRVNSTSFFDVASYRLVTEQLKSGGDILPIIQNPLNAPNVTTHSIFAQSETKAILDFNFSSTQSSSKILGVDASLWKSDALNFSNGSFSGAQTYISDGISQKSYFDTGAMKLWNTGSGLIVETEGTYLNSYYNINGGHIPTGAEAIQFSGLYKNYDAAGLTSLANYSNIAKGAATVGSGVFDLFSFGVDSARAKVAYDAGVAQGNENVGIANASEIMLKWGGDFAGGMGGAYAGAQLTALSPVGAWFAAGGAAVGGPIGAAIGYGAAVLVGGVIGGMLGGAAVQKTIDQMFVVGRDFGLIPSSDSQIDYTQMGLKLSFANGHSYLLGNTSQLQTATSMDVDILMGLKGNEHWRNNFIQLGNNTQGFVYENSMVFRTSSGVKYDYQVFDLNQHTFSSNNGHIQTPSNNIWMDNQTSFWNNTTDHTLSAPEVNFTNGTFLAGGNYTGNMLSSMLNGNGYQNVLASSISADDYRPGAGSLSSSYDLISGLRSTTNNLISNLKDLGSSLVIENNKPTGGWIASGLQSLSNVYHSALKTLNIDPLVLDMDGDGVELIAYHNSYATFDVDNDGSLENAGWVSKDDAILVHDVNNDGIINNVSETISEYYMAAPNTGKLYTDGLVALKTLDSNNDGFFNASDSMYNTLRVWQDANQDGRTDAGELKTLASVGITSIDLKREVVQREEIEGNPVLSRSTMVKNGVTHMVASVDFVTNPIGYEWNETAGGIKLTSDDDSSKTFLITNTAGATANFAGLDATTVIGNVGNDTIIGDAQNNWLIGGTGSDTLSGGAGDDVLVIDADDNLANIDAGSGFDTIQISDTRGVSINMNDLHAEVAMGGSGNDFIRGGGNTNVFVRGGKGNDVLIGGSADDALSGEEGDDTVDGGRGDDILRGHQGADVLIGNLGEDYLDGGQGDDSLYGDEGEDLLKGGAGNDKLYGGADYDVAEFSGKLDEYTVTALADGTVKVVDRVAGRDGTDILSGMEALNFQNIKEVALNLANPFTSNDVVSVTGTGPFNITAASLLANDLDYQGNALRITSVSDAVGGTVSLSGSNITFTPNASFNGVYSFKYKIADSSNNPGASAIIYATGQSTEMKGTVYLKQADHPNDPLFFDQWYMNDSNITPVWKNYTGKGINIGIFEIGAVDVTHADLVDNLSQSTIDGTDESLFSEHATLVAGVIGASRNNIGSVGVAYDATLSSTALGEGVNLNLNLIQNYKDYDIVNNSWSIGAPFIDSFQVAPNNVVPFVAAAQFGRDGLGTIIVNAAGNERQEGGSSNTSNFINNRYTIAVGAINKNADLSALEITQKPFSNQGSNILVSAPGSHISSTSILLENGNGSTFGNNHKVAEGTSFATPIVSGVVALMLEANSNLGYRDVQEILAYTARKVTDANTTWRENGANNINGHGLHYSHDYGFGNVDALAAVRLAETWNKQQVFTNEFSAQLSKTVNGNITNTQVLTSTINLVPSQNLLVEHVEVKVNIQHSRIGDLVITLVSPTGTESVLLNRLGKAPADASDLGHGAEDRTFTFSTVANWGETSTGNWTLKIEDKVSGEAGVLRSWEISTIGKIDSVNSDYIYTNEYSSVTLAADKVITDTAGDDTINTSAVQGNVTLNLNTGVNSTIAGNTMSILTGSTIERAIAGDGNDTLTGNSSNNLLFGGRGNDTLSGQAGNDWLLGAQGANIVTGGAGYDKFVVQNGDAGTTTIQDFSLTDDTVVIAGYPSIGFANLTLQAFNGTDTRFTLSDGQQVILKNTLPSNLTAGHFTFVESFSIKDVVLEKFYYMGTDASDAEVTYSGSLPTLMYGKGGNDRIFGGAGDDEIYGGAGNDVLVGSNASNHEGNGKDRLYGEDGDDDLYGAGDDDILSGGAGDDYVQGFSGNDIIYGGTGYNYLYGNDGNDTFHLEDGLNTVEGGNGSDTFKIYKDLLNNGNMPAPGTSFNLFNDIIADFNIAQDKMDVTEFTKVNSIDELIMQQVTINSVQYLRVFLDANYSQHFTLKGLQSSNLTASNFIFAPNTAPVANRDVYTINEDFALNFSKANLLLNDTDKENDAISFTKIVTGPVHGAITDLGNGNLSYVPHSNYSGDDSFVYEVKDSDGATSTSMVTIHINPVNDVPLTDLSSSISVSTGALFYIDSKFSDADGNPLVYTASRADGSALPSWLMFNATDGKFYGTAPVAQGSYDLKVAASDGEINTVRPFSLVIAAPDTGTLNDDLYLYGGGAKSIHDIGGANDTLAFGYAFSLEGILFVPFNEVDLKITAGAGNEIIIYSQLSAAATRHIEKLTFDDGFTMNLKNYSNWIWSTGTVNGDNNNAAGVDLADTIIGIVGNDVISGNDLDDVIHGRAGNDNLSGGSGNDLIYGGTGDDILNGGSGNDTLNGGIGSDTYIYLSGVDTITETTGTADRVVFDASLSINNARINGNILSFVSSTNSITFNDINHIEAFSFNGQSDMSLTQLQSYITSNSPNSSTFVATAAAEAFVGTGPSDTVDYSGSTVAVGVNFGSGLGSGGYAQGDTFSSIENIIGSNSTDSLTGNIYANIINGGAGNDVVQGGQGDDTLIGGSGSDTVSYASAGGGVTVNLSLTTAQNTVSAGIDTLSEFENITGSFYNDTLTGDTNANSISAGNGNDIVNGGDGNDTIQGGLGDDILSGGLGTDTLSYRNATSGTVTNLSLTTSQNTLSGWDTIDSFEYITGSDYDDIYIGSSVANNIAGNNGNDILQGGLGSDVLSGGAGADTFKFAAADLDSNFDSISDFSTTQGDKIDVQDLLVGYNPSTSAITNFVEFTTVGSNTVVKVDRDGSGTAYGWQQIAQLNNVTGLTDEAALRDNGNLIVPVGVPSSTFVATSAAEAFVGTGPSDTVDYSGSTVAVGVNLGNGSGSGGYAQGDTFSSIENIIGSNSTDSLTGNIYANIINGGAGNDAIQGGQGDDTLIGGSGSDTVSYASAGGGVTVNLSLTTAQNTVSAGIDTLSEFENITGSFYNDTLTGDTNANSISAGNGNDIVNGGDGNDTIQGGLGDDILSGGLGTDTLSYRNATSGTVTNLSLTTSQNTLSGWDTIDSFEYITGSDYDDIYIGSSVANNIAGNNGNDILQGGLGSDVLSGGAGADTFKFAAADLDSNFDSISDFSTTQGDRIDVKDILFGYDAVTSAITDFVEFTTAGSNTVVKVDRDGAGTSYGWQQIAQLNNVTGLTDEAALRDNGNLIVV